MKKLIYIAFTSLFCLSLFGQAPEKMSYQAVVLNGTNGPVVSSPVGIRISILQGSVSGSSVFVETHTPTSNANGLITLEIGAGTLVSGSFASIDWANGPYFLQTETDPLGGTNYTITGTSQLLSVPYALHAKTAESIVGGGSGGGAFTHYIGEYYGGGVIFNLWKDAQGVEHGLILDPFEITIPSGVTWSNVSNSFVDSVYLPNDFAWNTALSAWDGLSNSLAIASQPGHTNSYAALCLNSNQGGFNDWYMPSIEELNILWQNRFDVNRTLKNITGSAQILPYADPFLSYVDLYQTWFSSTEIDNDHYVVLNSSINTMIDFINKSDLPWYDDIDYYDGTSILQYKSAILRAVRAF